MGGGMDRRLRKGMKSDCLKLMKISNSSAAYSLYCQPNNFGTNLRALKRGKQKKENSKLLGEPRERENVRQLIYCQVINLWHTEFSNSVMLLLYLISFFKMSDFHLSLETRNFPSFDSLLLLLLGLMSSIPIFTLSTTGNFVPKLFFFSVLNIT